MASTTAKTTDRLSNAVVPTNGRSTTSSSGRAGQTSSRPQLQTSSATLASRANTGDRPSNSTKNVNARPTTAVDRRNSGRPTPAGAANRSAPASGNQQQRFRSTSQPPVRARSANVAIISRGNARDGVIVTSPGRGPTEFMTPASADQQHTINETENGLGTGQINNNAYDVDGQNAVEGRPAGDVSDDEQHQQEQDENHNEMKVVEFVVPAKKEADQFEASSFLTELRQLSNCLQAVLRGQLVQDFQADQLNDMVLTVTGTLEHYKVYATCVQELLDNVLNQMKTVSDLVYKNVLQPALIGRGSDWSEAKRRGRMINVAEAELVSRQQRLNSQLTKANENLQRATVSALEADLAATQAALIAEQAAEQARLAQAEYDERQRLELEAKKQEEERKALADRMAAEAEKRRQQERIAEEQRRAAARRPVVASSGAAAEATAAAAAAAPESGNANWPEIEIKHTCGTSDFNCDFDGGVTCILQCDPVLGVEQDSFKCEIIDPVKMTSLSRLFEDNEELISNIVQVSAGDANTSMESAEMSLLVSLPYLLTMRSAVREPVVKFISSSLQSPSESTDDQSWQQLATTEVNLESHKHIKFAQVCVTSLPVTLCVVLHPRKDYLHLSRHGDKITVSELDRNITFSSQRLPKREYFTLQLQTIDNDMKQRLAAVKGLLTTSSIFMMHWASKEFTKPITVTVPVPAHPVKLAKLAAARAAKNGKGKGLAGSSAGVNQDGQLSGAGTLTAVSTNLMKTLTQYQKQKADEQLQQQQTKNPDTSETGATVAGDGDKQPTSARKSGVQRWYMGEYDTAKDDDRDILYLIRRTPGGKWVAEEDIKISQPKIDLAEFDLLSPLNRFIIVRTKTSVTSKMAETFAETIEQTVHRRVVCSVIRQLNDYPANAIHCLVAANRLDRVLRRLRDEGYSSGPDPSKEFYVYEGERFDLSFQYNIQCCNHETPQQLSLVYLNNLDTQIQMTLSEVDKFLQKQENNYRGLIQVSRQTASSTHLDNYRKDPAVKQKESVVAAHQIRIPKDDDAAHAAMARPSVFSVMTEHVPSTFALETTDLPASSDGHALRYVAIELGDEWLSLAQHLRVRPTRIQNIRRRAFAEGLDETQVKYEMLNSWYMTQQHAVDKISILSSKLRRIGRHDLAHHLHNWKMDGVPFPTDNQQ